MNPASLFKIKSAFSKFAANHPKFPAFLQAAGNNMISEGSVIEITITAPDGRTISTNVLVKAEDMELFESLKKM